jgi:DNA modification methylase
MHDADGEIIMSASPSVDIIDQPIENLRAYENSPRTHNSRQYRKVSALIKKYGPVVPLVVDPNGVVVDGYLRLQCMKDLGYRKVPTVIVRSNSVADIRAMRLAFNRIPLDAGWDKQKLRDEFQELIAADYELDLTAFDRPEIDGILEIETPSIGIVDASDPVVAPEKIAVSRLGDKIVCGSHRIVCGNALDADAQSSLFGGEVARMGMTDPPYNVPMAVVGGKGATKHREFAMGSGEMSDDGFKAFLTRFIETAVRVLAEGALLYIWMDWRHIDALIAAGKAAGLNLANIAVWAKTSAGMGSLYRSQHEFRSVFKFGTAPHVNNVELGRHGRSRSNVWTARGMAGWGGDRDELLALHPTVKPVRLLADAILDASKRGDVVLDCFLGSGSTLIACEEIGRRCFGVELDPLYVDVAVRRWQTVTRKDAVFADTAETFNERSDRVQKAAAATAGAGDTETVSTPPSAPVSNPELQGRGHE